MRVYNQRKLKQLRAINYAYARKREDEARRLMAKCKELGLNIRQSAYAQITINRCLVALSKMGMENEIEEHFRKIQPRSTYQR